MVEMSHKFSRSDDMWQKYLTADEYAVLRQAATERPFTGELLDEKRDGLYTCRACANELFAAGTKFDSGCGWPSFYESVRPEAVELRPDNSLGMQRVEVLCARCGSHLGHVFPDGYGTPTGDRYCMNSVALNFMPERTWLGPTDDEIDRILLKAKKIAIVGLSPREDRPSHAVAAYLQAHSDYELYFVHPKESVILGQPVYPDLASLPVVPDIVDVFRRSEDIPEVLTEVIRVGAPVMWVQLGIYNELAVREAEKAGISVVMDRCIKIEHERIFPSLD